MNTIGKPLFNAASPIDVDGLINRRLEQISSQVDKVPEAEFDTKTDEQIAVVVAGKVAVALLQPDFTVAPEVREERLSRSANQSLPGLRVTKEIPFSGTSDLWRLRPREYGVSPKGDVGQKSVLIGITVPANEAEAAYRYINETVELIEFYIARQSEQIAARNNELVQRALQLVAERRKTITQRRGLLKRFQGDPDRPSS